MALNRKISKRAATVDLDKISSVRSCVGQVFNLRRIFNPPCPFFRNPPQLALNHKISKRRQAGSICDKIPSARSCVGQVFNLRRIFNPPCPIVPQSTQMALNRKISNLGNRWFGQNLKRASVCAAGFQAAADFQSALPIVPQSTPIRFITKPQTVRNFSQISNREPVWGGFSTCGGFSIRLAHFSQPTQIRFTKSQPGGRVRFDKISSVRTCVGQVFNLRRIFNPPCPFVPQSTPIALNRKISNRAEGLVSTKSKPRTCVGRFLTCGGFSIRLAHWFRNPPQLALNRKMSNRAAGLIWTKSQACVAVCGRFSTCGGFSIRLAHCIP